MKNKWRMPHPATMFLLLTIAVVFLSWICDIYGLKVTLPQTGEEIRVQSLLSPEGIRWWLRNAIKNFTGFAPLEVRVERAMKRDCSSRELVLKRIEAQMSDEAKREQADFVIVNDNETPLIPQVLELISLLSKNNHYLCDAKK